MGPFLTALALALAPAAPARAALPAGTLLYAHLDEVTSLDPAGPYDAISQSVIYNLYDTLIAFKGASLKEFEPRLAEVPTRANGGISKDGLTYRFKLRMGARFHDGSEVTAEDARYSLLRFMLTDRSSGPSSLLLEPILGMGSTRGPDGKLKVTFEQAAKAVRVEGDELVLTLPRPFAPFLSIMARWSYVMSKKDAVAKGAWDGEAGTWERFNDPKITDMALFNAEAGSGPFQLERWDRQGRILVMNRFKDYYRGAAALEKVVYKVVPEFSTQRLLIQGRDADMANVPFPMAQQMKGLEGVRVIDDLMRLATDPVLFFTYQTNPAGNTDIGSGKLDGKGIPPDFFSDADVRRGFACAFDGTAYLKDTFKGKAKRALGPIPPGLVGYDPKIPTCGHDLKKAEAYLRKAWGGKVWEQGFTFTLSYNTGGEVRQSACEILKANVESLNPKFKINLRPLDWAAFLDRTQRRLMPMWARGWIADYPDPHNFVFPFLHSQGRYALGQALAYPEFDALIDQGLQELDPKKRAALYSKLQRRAYEEATQIYTGHPPGVIVLRDAVKGWYDNPVFGGPYFYPVSKS